METPHTPISDGLSKQTIGKIQFAYDGIVTGYQSKIGSIDKEIMNFYYLLSTMNE
jgi:hypothetical protein